MQELPKIVSLWIGARLSFLEQLCLKSFADAGHEITLYVYNEVEGIPPGVKIADATELYRGEPFSIHDIHQTPAPHADAFRLKLMQRGHGEIWVDTDAYCYRPFDFDQPHIYGWFNGEVANGVLRLPADSPALAAYDEFLNLEEPDPIFYDDRMRAKFKMLRNMGQKIPLTAMPWGASGPTAFTHFLEQSGEIEYTKPEHVFYPASWQERRKFLRPTEKYMKNVRPDTVSFHFYGRIVRRILSEEFNSLPAPGSILESLCEKHNIDAAKAPIQWTRPPGVARHPKT